MAENQNDKKMPQGNQNQNQNQNQNPKSGMKPDMDQKKPQSGRQDKVGQEQPFDKKGNQNVKPEINEDGVKPQGNRGQLDDEDDLNDDDRITQRQPQRGGQSDQSSKDR